MAHWAAEGELRARGLALLALCDVFGLLLVATLIEALIGHAAVHLCGWPATLSCDRGVPLVWPAVRIFVWGFVVLAGFDLLAFVSRPTADAGVRVKAWAVWGPSVVLIAFNRVVDREVEAGDVVLGSALMLVALVLAGRAVAARTGVSERRIAWVTWPLTVVIVTAALWGPPAFTAAQRWERAAEGGAGGIEEAQPLEPGTANGATPPG